MWITDENGNPLNLSQVLALHVAVDPGDSEHYAVLAYNSIGTNVSVITTGSMSEATANALLAQITTLLGTYIVTTLV